MAPIGGVANDFFAGTEKKKGIDPAKRKDHFKPHLRLPGNSRGSNDFREIDHAVLLSVINPNYSQEEMLERLLGISRNEIVEIFGLQSLYQDFFRISPRDASVKRPQSGFVMDEHSAESLATIIPNVTVRQLPAAYIADPREPLKRGPKPTGNAVSGTERSRKSRFLKAERDRELKQAQREREAEDD
jgi:hypothetical protein